MLSTSAPLVLLLHGGLDNLSGKTGLALLRYRSGPILAVVDPAHAGADLEAITGIPRAVPIVASLAEARPPGSAAPKVRAIALNTAGLDPAGAQAALEQCRESAGLVCDDPVRHGGESLLRALLASPAGTAP